MEISLNRIWGVPIPGVRRLKNPASIIPLFDPWSVKTFIPLSTNHIDSGAIVLVVHEVASALSKLTLPGRLM
jgi:hypothetical protein